MPGVLLASVCRWRWLNPESGEVEVWTGWVNKPRGTFDAFNLLLAGICWNASRYLCSLLCLGWTGIFGLIGICFSPFGSNATRDLVTPPSDTSESLQASKGQPWDIKRKRALPPSQCFVFFLEELDIALTQIKVQFHSYFMYSFPVPCETPSFLSPYIVLPLLESVFPIPIWHNCIVKWSGMGPPLKPRQSLVFYSKEEIHTVLSTSALPDLLPDVCVLLFNQLKWKLLLKKKKEKICGF